MREIHKIREELHREWKKMFRGEVIKSVNRAGRDFERMRSSIKPLLYEVPLDSCGRVGGILEPEAMEKIHKIRDEQEKTLKRKRI